MSNLEIFHGSRQRFDRFDLSFKGTCEAGDIDACWFTDNFKGAKNHALLKNRHAGDPLVYRCTGELAAQLLDEADIREGETCLDPSAGMGGLANLMPQAQTTCVEISPLHCRVLEAKGHNVIEADFLAWAQKTPRRFDVVIMNPPYSEGRAVAHLNAAAVLVKNGGRLAAILPAGSDRKNLLPGWDCSWSAPMEGMFAGTGVRVVRLMAYKPE